MKTSVSPRLPYAALLTALLILSRAARLATCQSNTPARPAAPASETAVPRAELLSAWELLDVRALAPGTAKSSGVQN